MSEDTSVQVVDSQATQSELSFLDQIFIKGLEVIMGPGKSKDFFNKKSYIADILLPRLHFLNPEIQGFVLQSLFAENPSIFIEDDSWWNFVTSSIARLEELDGEKFFPQSGLYVLLNRIKDLREEVDWYSVFITLSNSTTIIGSKCQGFLTVLNWLIQADPENLRKILYRTESKSYPASVKSDLYKEAINLGIFDVKIARRVRSDSSGGLSSDILSHLFENRIVYADEMFQDLVTQFSDTKHKWVARYIAINMPMHLVPFLMGIKDDVALKILEKRMEVSEDT